MFKSPKLYTTVRYVDTNGDEKTVTKVWDPLEVGNVNNEEIGELIRRDIEEVF